LHGRVSKQWVKDLVKPYTELISQYVTPRPVGHRQDQTGAATACSQTGSRQIHQNERHAAWELNFFKKDECHAAWERFGKPENERHAAWERSSPRSVPPNGSPENAPNHLFQYVSEHFWSSTGAPTLSTPKNGSAQVDINELPRQSHKTYIFLAYSALFALRDPFGGRSQRALHFENMQKSIHFITFMKPLLSPTSGTKRNNKNAKRAPRCMGARRRKQK